MDEYPTDIWGEITERWKVDPYSGHAPGKSIDEMEEDADWRETADDSGMTDGHNSEDEEDDDDDDDGDDEGDADGYHEDDDDDYEDDDDDYEDEDERRVRMRTRIRRDELDEDRSGES